MEPGIILGAAERIEKLGPVGVIVSTILFCSALYGVALWRVWALFIDQRRASDAMQIEHLRAIETRLAQIEAVLRLR